MKVVSLDGLFQILDGLFSFLIVLYGSQGIDLTFQVVIFHVDEHALAFHVVFLLSGLGKDLLDDFVFFLQLGLFEETELKHEHDEGADGREYRSVDFNLIVGIHIGSGVIGPVLPVNVDGEESDGKEGDEVGVLDGGFGVSLVHSFYQQEIINKKTEDEKNQRGDFIRGSSFSVKGIIADDVSQVCGEILECVGGDSVE